MKYMEIITIYAILAVFGLCLGSFAAATVWRLRARQLVQDKQEGEKVSKREYDALLSLTKEKLTTDYSRCLHCRHRLSWYDMVPLFSWIQIGGKCRYCRKPIGPMEPLAELGVALFFVVSFWLWPEPFNTGIVTAQFVVWLISGVMLAILFMYDLRWFLLPNQVVFPLVGVGVIAAVLTIATDITDLSRITSLAGAVAILSGLYGILWAVSKGAWIGFGDVKLGLALALLLGRWELAFIALFAANVIGCIIVLPGIVTGRLKRTSHVPFGPFLIAGYAFAGLCGAQLLGWYFSLTF